MKNKLPKGRPVPLPKKGPVIVIAVVKKGAKNTTKRNEIKNG